ncbi:MAG: glycoside hydrolase family 3 C-terminal domain-containing protein [Clostridiales bacterium]|jgi:beta-glucosidase|nr:glycoside hydrolase family 3 C-terminal domain-containing protein [Clostridiales bacterium]
MSSENPKDTSPQANLNIDEASAAVAPCTSAKDIVAQLTTEEKASLASGKSFWETRAIERLNIPSVVMTDGPHGIRKVDETRKNNVMQISHKATCFPTAVTVAATWNRELAYEMGAAIAEEAKTLGVSTVLGPGINIKRSPLCGRNFEYYSEDPHAAGEMGAAFVNGVQSRGIGTSLKHYFANNQEHLRLTVSVESDERTIREIYLSAFETVVKKANPETIMCSYNRVNGLHLSDNKKYLSDVLRGEWGYQGIVVSDWGAVNDRVKGIEAGLDLQMPHSAVDDKLVEDAVKTGDLDEALLDVTTERMVKFAFDRAKNVYTDYKADIQANRALARKIAADGAVLLKNEDGILPLAKDLNDCLIVGTLAKKIRYQGAGSSKINAFNAVSFIDYLNNAGIKHNYLEGYKIKKDCYDKKLLLEAREAAKKAGTVIIFAGLTDEFEGEGYDRKHLNIPHGQTNLINEISAVNKNVIVVLLGGSPVKMPFIANVKAVLNLYLGGEAGGEAAADVLFGDVNPSGKLSETYPLSLDDVLANKYFPMGPRTVEYRENIFVGYRYFDTAKKAVLFPFGYGLSYTDFTYGNLKVSREQINEDDTLKVSFDITNTGKVYGGEVAQLYIKDVESTVFRPEKELKAFDKVYLNPDETKTVECVLDSRAFAYYNVNISDWAVESGDFEILVGASSRDIRLKSKVHFVSKYTNIKHPDYRKSAPSYYKIGSVLAIPDSDFEKLTGRKIDPNLPFKKGEFDKNSTLSDIKVTLLGNFLYHATILGAKIVSIKSENKDMIIKTAPSMPIRSAGMLSPGITKFLIKTINGTKKAPK